MKIHGIESITNRKWGDSHGYELCVDSSIGVDETANLICSYINNKASCAQGNV